MPLEEARHQGINGLKSRVLDDRAATKPNLLLPLRNCGLLESRILRQYHAHKPMPLQGLTNGGQPGDLNHSNDTGEMSSANRFDQYKPQTPMESY